MVRSFNGKTPRIAESAYVSEAAYVVGDVEIGEDSSVWPGAVIRGDFTSIKIGRSCAIEDNCVIHGGSPTSPEDDLIIGDMVIMGHGSVVNCHKIGDNVLIGMNATILHDAEIGNSCIISAGSLVGPGMKIPDRSFVAGVPGEIKGAPSSKQLAWTKKGFQHIYVDLGRKYKEQGL